MLNFGGSVVLTLSVAFWGVQNEQFPAHGSQFATSMFTQASTKHQLEIVNAQNLERITGCWSLVSIDERNIKNSSDNEICITSSDIEFPFKCTRAYFAYQLHDNFFENKNKENLFFANAMACNDSKKWDSLEREAIQSLVSVKFTVSIGKRFLQINFNQHSLLFEKVR